MRASQQGRPRPLEPTRDAAIGLALGIYPTHFLGLPPATCAWILVGLALCAALVALVFGQVPALVPASQGSGFFVAHRRHARVRLLALAAGLLLAACLQPGLAARAAAGASGLPPDLVVLVEGTLSRDAAPTRGGFRRYELSIDGTRSLRPPGASASSPEPRASARGALLVLARNGPPFAAGARLSVSGSPRTDPDGAQVLFCEPAALVFRGFDSPLAALRAKAMDAFIARLSRLGRRAPGLLVALLSGRRDWVEPGLSDAFARSGCAHILSLSGQHLAVLAAMVGALLGPALGPRRTTLAAALFAACYAAFAGGDSPILRSALMFAWGAAAKTLDRPQRLGASLGAAFLILTLARPEAAFGLSFAFTFLALWGIEALAPPWAYTLSPYLPPAIATPLSVALAAWTASSALGIVAFGYLPLAGPLVSPVADFLTGALMWCGVACACVTAVLPALEGSAGLLCDLLHDALVAVIESGGLLPPLQLGSSGAKLASLLLVAAIGALVYARPHVDQLRYRQKFERIVSADRENGAERQDRGDRELELKHQHDQRKARRGLRRARVHFRPAREPRPGYAQALRPELPRGASGEDARGRRDRPARKRERVGDRPGYRRHDPPGA